MAKSNAALSKLGDLLLLGAGISTQAQDRHDLLRRYDAVVTRATRGARFGGQLTTTGRRAPTPISAQNTRLVSEQRPGRRLRASAD